jgi:hypothetical protein
MCVSAKRTHVNIRTLTLAPAPVRLALYSSVQ